MTDKGYPHPLYSLDLCPHGAGPEDEPRYGILRPEGRLVVRAELRRRAQDHPVLAVDHFAGTVLAYQRLLPGAFERFGLGQSWAESMRFWRAWMLEEDQVQMVLLLQREQAAVSARQLLSEAGAALRHLVLSARLAGLGDRVAAGAAPRGAAALLSALTSATARGKEPAHAALLSRCGFGAAEQAALRRLLLRLPRAAAQRSAIEARCRTTGDAVLVIRAALLGDAARLCQVAPQVLGEERCRALRIAKLLGRRSRPAAGPRPAPL